MARPSFRKKKDENSEVRYFSDNKITVGSVRKTQLITTYGIGSIVDFKDDTVIIASTDEWDYDKEKLEDRKIFNENLSIITKAKYFVMPETKNNSSVFSKEKNIHAYIFPEKQHCSSCGNIYDINELDIKKRHICPACKSRLTASRFVIACNKGHIDDFPYNWWVHSGGECSGGSKNPRIKMKNINNRNDIGSLMLECTECGAKRSMMQIFSPNSMKEFKCTCNHPHFRDPKNRASFGCSSDVLVRLRASSGVYFPITKSALLIPPWSNKAVRYIQKNYELLSAIPESRRISILKEQIADDKISDYELVRSWNAVEKFYDKKESYSEASVMKDEYDVLSERANEKNEGFSSYSAEIPGNYNKIIEQIAVVEKLTVTQAFTGFSRISRNEGNKVDISQYPKEWLPAVELTGEGIFIRFKNKMIENWMRNNSSHYRRMEARLKEQKYGLWTFSPAYVLLHTFSHLFIREISNICGYSTASIKEKIYCEADNETGKVSMCGVLVYVSSPDNESSLGGLISIADDSSVMERILDSMLERAEWCSGDPLCISSMQQGYNNLNYAACHDCTLLPETSCECFNILLDRASVIGLPNNRELGFFNQVNQNEYCGL